MTPGNADSVRRKLLSHCFGDGIDQFNGVQVMNQIVQNRVSNVKTIEEAEDVWRAHRPDLKGCTLVLAMSQQSPYRFPARLNLPGDGFLRSVFACDYLHFVSDDSVDQQVSPRTREIAASYSVSFDSSTASYLRSLALGRRGNSAYKLVHTIRALGSTFGTGGFLWDPFPFLLERADAISEGRDEDFVFETLIACERLAVCDLAELQKNGSIASRIDESEIERRAKAQIEWWKQGLRSGLGQAIRHRLNLFYAFALKTAIIHLKRPSTKDAQVKLKELLEFLGDSVCCLPQLTGTAALEFFTKGHKFAPFQKLASRKPGLKKEARNVAWDFLHVQMGHECTGFHGTDGPFCVRYFLTFDRPLAELFDSFPQRSCLICPDGRLPLFFADFDFPSQVLDQFPRLGPVIGKHYTLEADEDRRTRSQAKFPDIQAIITDLESEIDQLGRPDACRSQN